MKFIKLFGLIVAVILVLSIGSLRAELASTFEAADTVFASNTVIDIVAHNNGVWFATGEGVNFSFDDGFTWLLYNSANGLAGENISSIYSIGNRLWVGMNHDVSTTSGRVVISDGLAYTEDNGDTWIRPDFGELNLLGVDRSVYDIAGHQDFAGAYGSEDWLFMSTFAGAFLASQDGGLTWRRIFPSVADSINYYTPDVFPNLANRVFSCEVDTTHGDTLYVWEGTAAGIYQYIYAIPRQKPYTAKRIQQIARNDQRSGEDDDFVFYAGDLGITRGFGAGGPYLSRFEQGDSRGPSDGLPGPFISAITVFNGRVYAGTMDSAETTSTGLALSDDFGDTYQAMSSFTDVIGANRRISDFEAIGSRLYMAAEEAGLFVSDDNGASWNHLWVDLADTSGANARNFVHALDATGDTLRVGTDSGLVSIYLNPSGAVDSTYAYPVFVEDDSSSTKVVGVEIEDFYNPSDGTWDSLAIWTMNVPLTGAGTACILRTTGADNRSFVPFSFQVGLRTYDMAFLGDSVFVAGEEGVRFARASQNGIVNMTFTHEVKDPDKPSSTAMTGQETKVFDVYGDTILIGSDSGFAISTDRGESYSIHRINRDTLAADAVVRHNSIQTGINGNFIPAMGLQEVAGEWARVWASTRSTSEGESAGISVGSVVALVDSVGDTVSYERDWAVALDDVFAWNFAFNGDTIYAATNEGLLYNDANLGLAWGTIDFTDLNGTQLIDPGTPVYAVSIIDDQLWVGTDDRTVRLSLSNYNDASTFYVIDSSSAPDEVYSFPAPFSHSLHDAIDFHFVVENEASITIEIYDFAMHLVRRLVEGQVYPPGIYPTVGGFRQTWDGLNGRGDEVAVGMYHFKITYSTGEERWGKIAVIP